VAYGSKKQSLPRSFASPSNCQARGTTSSRPSFAPELKRNSKRLEGRANTSAVRLDRIFKLKAPSEVRYAAVVRPSVIPFFRAPSGLGLSFAAKGFDGDSPVSTVTLIRSI
jgi:hypothetical protein